MVTATVIGGDPARPEVDVTLDNWQSPAQLRWSFQHLAEIFPSATISRGRAPTWRFPARPTAFDELSVPLPDGSLGSVGGVLAATETDGWMVLHQGVVLAEQYPAMRPDGVHLLMSVSKSLVGTLVGILADRGLVEVDAPVSHYAPGLAASGYAGATVRNVLDMRSGVRFSEHYLDPDAEVRRIEEAFGWARRREPWVPEGMYPFLTTLRAERPHGEGFRYRSCESDVLGWVCEGATGQSFNTLLSDLLWSPMGAAHDAVIGVDAFGTGMFDGGISAGLGDLVRFGALWLNKGRTEAGVQVVPPWWVADTFAGGPDSAQAFAASPDSSVMPGGMYRNQFWFPFAHRDVMLALGIHGQMIYVNRRSGTVAAKLSSWPEPQSAWKLFSTLSAFETIAGTLA